MRIYHNPADHNVRDGDRLGLGAVLLLNLFERLKCGICGPNPVPSGAFSRVAQVIDPGYCIDAPNVMPAGGMGNFCCPTDEDEPSVWLAEQLTCEREGIY